MPFAAESVGPVLSVLRRATDLETLNGALSAVGRIGDIQAVPEVLALLNHFEPSVRLTVAMALPGLREAPEVVPALIELTRDADEDVRDWAVFGLMNSFDDDTPEVWQAFLDRLEDPNATVRGQALLGIARRRVPGTLEAVAHEFERPEIHPDALEAVSELGDPRGMELLERLRMRFPDWDVIPYEMERLRKA
jgi:HEAT repeat protein